MTNIASYLNLELLRFTTAGSVDDGKSTLIGRLLYDSKSIFEDQYAALKRTSELRGEENVNLAYLTDGLKAEREQGITIDVAHRYFSTPKRKFIIYDVPGHVQYTRNMITGASNTNLVLLLVDARKGIIEQTKRHAFIASLLKIPHLIICINKMDLVHYSKDIYEKIKDDFSNFSAKLEINDVRFIPISALYGDNVVNHSEEMKWYKDGTLLSILENIHIASDENLIDCRFPVQYIIRPNTNEYHDYRGIAGKVTGGIFKPGDKIMVIPSNATSRIKYIDTFEGQVDEAFPQMSVTLVIEDNIDISRGDMIVREHNQPTISQDVELIICWMSTVKLRIDGKYLIKHTTNEVKSIIKEIRYKVDINTLHRIEGDNDIGLNDIARISIKTTKPLYFDKYKINRHTGSVIIIDENTNETVGAGMII